MPLDLDLIRATKGFLADDEGRHLYQVALEAAHLGPCLEIGSYCGKSTVCIGTACRESGQLLFAIDHHRGSEEQQPVVRKNTASLEQLHVRNFLSCVNTRQKPNSDVVSGHRSALASHLGKMAYLKKQQIKFDPASERDHTL